MATWKTCKICKQEVLSSMYGHHRQNHFDEHDKLHGITFGKKPTKKENEEYQKRLKKMFSGEFLN